MTCEGKSAVEIAHIEELRDFQGEPGANKDEHKKDMCWNVAASDFQGEQIIDNAISWLSSAIILFIPVDGRNPAPVDTVGSLSHYLQGFIYTSQVVQDFFFHQQL